MTKLIYKYNTENCDGAEFKINGLINPICAKLQNGKIIVWCEVDKESTIERTLSVGIKATGYEEIFDNELYLDTVIFESGLVYHIYTTIFV